MSFINSIIKVFVGDKSQKDVKALQPYLNKIKTFESSLMSLSHDELRARTTYFKERIKKQEQIKMQRLLLLKPKLKKLKISTKEKIFMMR